VQPGGQVTLSWATTGAARVTISANGPTSDVTARIEVPATSSLVVQPQSTTSYTLTAFNQPGHTPESVTSTITARVVLPPSVGTFSAAPTSIEQGDAALLSWTGTAASWSVSDDRGGVFNLGPRRSLLVRPAADTTYTLHGAGPGGPLSSQPAVKVSVTPHPASRLSYQPPSGGALQLLADACADPCAGITLRVRAASDVPLRGFALNLPLDLTKVSFDPATFVSSLAGAPARAALGKGPLAGTLVMAAALEGIGTAAATDVTLPAGAELLRFNLSLISAGGRGSVFSGAAPVANPVYKALIQSASGRSANLLAVGSLDAD
jgi:hypothetical protein